MRREKEMKEAEGNRKKPRVFIVNLSPNLRRR